MTGLLFGAVAAGLVGSPHCVGMCGGFAASAGWPWHVGRLAAYAALGALAGVAGRGIPGPTWLAPAVSGALLVWFAARLAGIAPELGVRVPGVTRLATAAASRRGLPARVAFGAVSALLPCGLVWSALALAVAAASPAGGATVLLAFGLGTVPLLAVATAGLRLAGARSRRLLAAGVLAAGLWSIATRAGPPPPGDGEVCHTSRSPP